ncbi:uncharacterized protein GGS22DRAFT_169895 [Annulohypoxylon maeteangense]|uniref:uncharacterized protein n=1 Tax=Annulohypoxylon maeteangense TaxID=1927788 RepID=UPI002008E415|nr:uncharacterized protein GGS22DRAFT_169895 [Annulohypoxylon maeteangense]KAI0882618.1 hypothetical protein GGS22DRAFT_169895 [Annulohypoxylon maeteangense]
MTSSMGSLSSELLIEIFFWVKSSFPGASNLLPCLTVCRQWYEIVVPVLYRHIVLNTDNVELFASRFNLQHASYVRSLTLRPTQPTLSSYDLSSIIAANAELGRRLLRLEPLLGSLDRLLSFSLHVPAIVPERCRFKISARSIIGLVNSIPQSCVNIEIDSGGYDRNIIAGGEEAHVCECLRLLLPRMNHVRIHLSLVCPALVGVMATPYQYEMDSLTPAKFPHLRSFLINCSEKNTSNSICLPAKTKDTPLYRHSIHPWPAMTSALQRFVDTPDCCPASALIRIHTTAGKDMANLGIHNTMVVCDINSHTTHAFPIVEISPHRRFGWLVRFDDSEGIITTSRGLVDVAEGQLWKTLMGGARLPSPIADSEAQGILEVPIVEEAVWRAKNPEIDCALWNNEALVGRKLLHAEIRKEGKTYMNPVPILEERIQ